MTNILPSGASIGLGINRGLDGEFCLLVAGAATFRDMPTLTLAGGNRKRRKYDAAGVRNIIMDFMEQLEPGVYMTVAIEKQQVMPARSEDGEERGKGSFGHFQSGYGYGLLTGVVVGLGLPYDCIAPRSWKAALLRDMPKGKDASRQAAMRMFPAAAADLKLKKHHNRADAP